MTVISIKAILEVTNEFNSVGEEENVWRLLASKTGKPLVTGKDRKGLQPGSYHDKNYRWVDGRLETDIRCRNKAPFRIDLGLPEFVSESQQETTIRIDAENFPKYLFELREGI